MGWGESVQGQLKIMTFVALAQTWKRCKKGVHYGKCFLGGRKCNEKLENY